jgi:hypothetical protein
MVFGVKPGMLIQSSYLGIGFQRVMPYLGFDWVGLKVDTDDNDLSASLLIPHLGAKLYLKDYREAKTVAPYILGDIFFSLPSVSADNASSDEEEFAEDMLGFWGVGLGFGAEYFFSKNFSVGGEYGIRFLNNGVEERKERHEDPYWGPHEHTLNEEFSIAFKLSYAVISANFFF